MPVFDKISEYNEIMSEQSISKRLAFISGIAEHALFTTSLGREDQLLLWNIAETGLPIRVVTLQTLKLFPETLSLLQITRDRYVIDIEEVEPEPSAVAAFIDRYGENGFYDGVEARKSCCKTRKIEPLTKALQRADAWITGMTRQQSDGRSQIPFAEWDEAHDLLKFNPLADLTEQQLVFELEAHEIPVNVLHGKGFPSIGCQPCTRAIRPGEHPRAGRWWWEQNASSECGLHQPDSQPNSSVIIETA